MRALRKAARGVEWPSLRKCKVACVNALVLLSQGKSDFVAASNSRELTIPRHNQKNRHSDTLGLYHKLLESGTTPTVSTLLAALKACVALRALETGRRIHLQAGPVLHPHIANALVDMYAKCGSMPEAHQVFDSIRDPNLVSWNAIIMGYASNGQGYRALELFRRMCLENYVPDARIFIAALKACAGLTTKEEGEKVGDKCIKTACLEKVTDLHRKLAKYGYDSDLYVASTLVDAYAKCGSMSDARKVFDGMPNRDVVSWTSVIMGYAERGEGPAALELFERMKAQGLKPDARTYVAALKGCGSAGTCSYENKIEDEECYRELTNKEYSGADYEEHHCSKEELEKEQKSAWLAKGVTIHTELTKTGCEANPFVTGSLVEMYAKCGSLKDARCVFDRALNRSLVLWNSIIMAYGHAGEEKLALEMFERMKGEGFVPDARSFVVTLNACTSIASKGRKWDCLEKGRVIHAEAVQLKCETDIFVANTLLDMYAKCGSMVEARNVFDEMRIRTAATWNTMIAGYAQNGEEEVALEIFQLMKEKGSKPSSRHFVSALKACGRLGALGAGRNIHKEIMRSRLDEDLAVVNSLVHFYGMCGSMTDARQVLAKSRRRKELVTWNALISGYTRQGDARCAIGVLEEMHKEVKPNNITYLLVLNACTRTGLVKEGMDIFQRIKQPRREHFTCVVDLLGRSNRLNEALNVVLSMPCKADATLWRAVLASCHKWNNVEIGEVAFENVIELDGGDATAYVMMGNIYAATEMWEEYSRVQELKTSGILATST